MPKSQRISFTFLPVGAPERLRAERLLSDANSANLLNVRGGGIWTPSVFPLVVHTRLPTPEQTQV